jgi:UDP-N-acetyl-D-glucosamine dehydrogenase
LSAQGRSTVLDRPNRVGDRKEGRFAVVDCFCILDDRRIERYFELGCEVKGMGRGHIQRIKERVRSRRK